MGVVVDPVRWENLQITSLARVTGGRSLVGLNLRFKVHAERGY